MKFYGKYRGVVSSNNDPEQRGRLQVRVPAVYGDNDLNWALPCAPYSGTGVGFFAVPPVGAFVWVEFEAGDLDFPIWCGGFWPRGDAPSTSGSAAIKILKTDSATITLDDTQGASSITIETGSGMKIAINQNGIELNNGQGASIKLSGTQISLNEGALEVV